MSLYLRHASAQPVRIDVYPKRRAQEDLMIGFDTAAPAAAEGSRSTVAAEPRYADFLRDPEAVSSVA